MTELRQLALQALQCPDFEQKVALARMLPAQSAMISVAYGEIDEPSDIPGRPARPQLLAHLDVKKRSLHTPEGLAALIHSVCHIEFNAINLALDAVWRFAGMPREFYLDWARVASEEAYHFSLLSEQLQTLGYAYGDFPAHNGLWDMTHRTRGDIVARMALVPRTLEARGLDATPPMQAKLRKLGTPEAQRTVEILDIILRDEVGHVAIGNHWFRWLCEQRGLDPIAHFKALARQYQAPRMRPPLNESARLQAGFSAEEIKLLHE
jgi:uncharacterized ferritin-like protein (DUF455 family)